MIQYERVGTFAFFYTMKPGWADVHPPSVSWDERTRNLAFNLAPCQPGLVGEVTNSPKAGSTIAFIETNAAEDAKFLKEVRRVLSHNWYYTLAFSCRGWAHEWFNYAIREYGEATVTNSLLYYLG
jgi:hypothetical protein